MVKLETTLCARINELGSESAATTIGMSGHGLEVRLAVYKDVIIQLGVKIRLCT